MVLFKNPRDASQFANLARQMYPKQWQFAVEAYKDATRMKRFLPTLRKIHRKGDNAKREYVKRCNRQFIDCVSECAKNVLKGNVPLTNAQMSKLRLRRQDLRALSVKKTSLAKKRKIIQKGGFLSALLAPALSVLAGLLLK